MFDFIRKRKDSSASTRQSPANDEPEKSRRNFLRRSAFVSTGKGEGSSAKRTRPQSVPPNVTDEMGEPRPTNFRARSSSCSAIPSIDIHNPFRQYTEDSAMTASQIALTEAMSSSTLPNAQMRCVTSHAPVIVSPQAERAEVLFHDGLSDPRIAPIELDPFSDDAFPVMSNYDYGDEVVSEQKLNAERVKLSRHTSQKKSRASPRVPADYLQVKIPASVLSPPLLDGHRAMWARI